MCEQEFPSFLSNAGTVRAKTGDPCKSEQDQSAEDSYWWMFRDLLDEIKGDENGTLFSKKKEIARKTFDRLEQKWMISIREVEEAAAVLNGANKRKEAIAHVTAFSKRCLEEAIAAIEEIYMEVNQDVLA
jgi:secernin